MELLQKVFRKAGSLPTGIGSKSTTVIGKIETLRNVHGIMFHFTVSGTAATRAEILTDIGRIVVRVNGQPIVDATATELLDLYKYHYDSEIALTTAGVVPVLFTRPHLPVAAMQRGFALGMLGEDGVSHNVLSYEITTLAPSSMTITAGSVTYVHDTLPSEKLGNHLRITSHDRTYSSTGYQDITDMPKDEQNMAVLAYHIHKGNCASIGLKINGQDRLEDCTYDVLTLAMNRAGRSPQSGYTHVPLDLDNDLASMQPMGPGNVVDLLLRPYWSTSPGGAYKILIEEIHTGL